MSCWLEGGKHTNSSSGSGVIQAPQTKNRLVSSISERKGKQMPKVSILMPAFNTAPTLGDAIASVRNQSFRDWELIIVDDASQDDTYASAIVLADADPRIHVRRHDRNTGAAAARNTALHIAKGQYIAFLDADDLWHADKLTRQIRFMEETGAALSYTGFWRTALQDGSPERHEMTVPAQIDRQTLLRGNVIGCLTAVYDRKVLGKRPMPALDICEDFALWLGILSSIDAAHGLTCPLATRRVRPGSLTSNRWHALRALWHMYRQHLNFGWLTASWLATNHLLLRMKRG
ncbi:MAG: glycosyltransferase family 2 protein [Pseudomonadota bacterium]